MQYYGVMSMALAESLLKQTADTRLSVLRQEHNCHGLSMVLPSLPKISDSANEVMQKLRALPQVGKDAKPKGTFEVWRRSARELPVGGEAKEVHGASFSSGFRALLIGDDAPFAALGKSGMSLGSCLENLPYMEDTLNRWGSRLSMIRATLAREHNQTNGNINYTFIVHPSHPDLVDQFNSQIVCSADFVNDLTVIEMPSGYILNYKENPHTHVSFPCSTSITTDATYFSCHKPQLSEFGNLYVALHIAGNFARYYPEIWIKHIESNSPLASLIETLCTNAQERLPLLMLSEMTQKYHVIER